MEHKTTEECTSVFGGIRAVEKDGKCSDCGYIFAGIDATNSYCDSPGVWDCPSCKGRGTFSSVYTNQELGWLL